MSGNREPLREYAKACARFGNLAMVKGETILNLLDDLEKASVHSAPTPAPVEAAQVVEAAEWALNTLAECMARLEGTGNAPISDYKYDSADRKARNTVAAFKDALADRAGAAVQTADNAAGCEHDWIGASAVQVFCSRCGIDKPDVGKTARPCDHYWLPEGTAPSYNRCQKCRKTEPLGGTFPEPPKGMTWADVADVQARANCPACAGLTEHHTHDTPDDERCSKNLKGHRWSAWFLDFEDNSTEFHLCVDCGYKTHRARRDEVVHESSPDVQSKEEQMLPVQTNQQVYDDGYRTGKFQGGLPAKDALEALYAIQRVGAFSEDPAPSMVEVRELARAAAQKLVAAGLGPENAPVGGYFPYNSNERRTGGVGVGAEAPTPAHDASTTTYRWVWECCCALAGGYKRCSCCIDGDHEACIRRELTSEGVSSAGTDVKAWCLVGEQGNAYNLRWPMPDDDPEALRKQGYVPLVVRGTL